jgi:hypothetical protein
MCQLDGHRSTRDVKFAVPKVSHDALKLVRGATRVVSLIALLAGCVSAQSRPQDKNKTEQRQTQSDSVQRGTETEPIVVKTLPVAPTKEQSDKEEADRERQRDAYRWTFRFALATVLVGLLQAYIYWRQARSLRDTIAKMDEIAKAQATDMAAYIAQTTRFAAGVEGIVSSMNANLALVQDALAINRDIAETNKRIANAGDTEFRASHRAWLHLAYFAIDWGKENPAIRLVVKNSGKRAATITSWAACCVVGPLQPVPDAYELIHHGNCGSVPPNGEVVSLEANVPLGWTTVNWGELLKGQRNLSVWGIINYDTGFPDIPGELGFGHEYVATAPYSNYGERFAATDAPGYTYSK